MPSLLIPPSGLSIEAPRPSSKSGVPRPDILSLTLSDNVIEDMIKCVRNGKGLQLSLGPDPKILYGAKVQHFETTPDPFTNEIYHSFLPSNSESNASDPHTSDEMVKEIKVTPRYSPYFFGVPAPQKLQPYVVKRSGGTGVFAPRAGNTTGGSTAKFPDAALVQLENSLALENAKKLQNQTQHVTNSSSLPPAANQRGSAQSVKAGKKNRFLAQPNSLAGNTTRSMPTSPALNSLSSPAVAPTSVPLSQQQALKAKTVRSPIIHQLAIRPATEHDLFKYKTSSSTDQEFRLAIEKVAELENGLWKLKTKSFKELEVWTYIYTSQEDRQSAIDNAVRAYDKLRLGQSEPEWEKLLPKEERGTGKCLSKLQAKIAINAANGNRPTNSLKAAIHRAEDSGRDTAAEEDDEVELLGDRGAKSPASGVNMTRSYSQPPTTKLKKVGEKVAQAKRLLAKPGKPPKAVGAKKVEKKPEKESTKFKSSEFVSDSDEDEDDVLPSAKKLTDKVTPSKTQSPAKPSMKRSREDTDVIAVDSAIPAMQKSKRDDRMSSASSASSTISKHRVSDASQTSRSTATTSTSFTSSNSRSTKGTTSPQKSSPLASSPPTNATDIEDSYQTSSSTSSYNNSHSQGLKRKAEIGIDGPAIKRHQKTPSSSTSSITSNHDNEPSAEIRELSARFKVYYNSYAQLHRELTADESRRKKDIKKLLDMQERLTKMKREILRGA